MAEHFCTEHNQWFFKTAKMRAYSHPTEKKDENGKTVWCNEPDRVIRTPADLPGPKATPEPLKSTTEASPKPLPYQVEIEARARNAALIQASEEARVAVKTIADLRMYDNILTDKSPEYQAVLRWCRERLGVSPDAPERKEQPSKTGSGVVAPTEKDETPITAEQLKHLTDLTKETSMTLTALGKWMKEQGWKVNRLIEIRQWQYNDILKAFEKGKP